MMQLLANMFNTSLLSRIPSEFKSRLPTPGREVKIEGFARLDLLALTSVAHSSLKTIYDLAVTMCIEPIVEQGFAIQLCDRYCWPVPCLGGDDT